MVIVERGPAGISKSNTASLVSPEFTTVAGCPSTTVVTVPTASVAARPAGISKSNTASLVSPELVTVGGLP